MNKKYIPPAQSLENLKLGGKSRKRGGLDRVKKTYLITQACADTLAKSGNASRFIEMLVQAHREKRCLTAQEILEGELTPDLSDRL